MKSVIGVGIDDFFVHLVVGLHGGLDGRDALVDPRIEFAINRQHFGVDVRYVGG